MGLDVLSLIVFALCIALFIWDKLPMGTTAVLGCLVMVVLNICDFKTAFGQFSSSTVILTVAVMIIGAAISETGLAETVGKWIVKVSGGSETKLIVGTYLVSAVMSAFLTNSAVLAIFIPIVMGLSAANKDIKSKNLIMPIAYGCVIGGTSTLVGSTQQMTAQGLLEEHGLKMFKTFDFLPVVAVIIVLGLVYCLTVGKKLGNRIWGNRTDDDVDYDMPKSAEAGSKSKQIIMALIFAMTVVFYITDILPVAVTACIAAVLSVVFGCIPQKKAFASVNWNIVVRLAGCLGLAKALSAAGGTDLIANGFKALVGDSLNPFILFAILVLLVQVSSEFMSNSTAILIVLPIVIAIAPALSLNVYSFALGITIASGTTLSCPLASSTLGMSMCAGYKFKDYLKYSIAFDIICYVTIITLVPIFYGLTV